MILNQSPQEKFNINRKKIELKKEQIIELYKSGTGSSHLSRIIKQDFQIEMSSTSLLKVLKEWGVEMHNIRTPKKSGGRLEKLR